jgi:hypothetical protein
MADPAIRSGKLVFLIKEVRDHAEQELAQDWMARTRSYSLH